MTKTQRARERIRKSFGQAWDYTPSCTCRGCNLWRKANGWKVKKAA